MNFSRRSKLTEYQSHSDSRIRNARVARITAPSNLSFFVFNRTKRICVDFVFLNHLHGGNYGFGRIKENLFLNIYKIIYYRVLSK